MDFRLCILQNSGMTFVGPIRLLICFTVSQMKAIGLFGSFYIKLRKICRKKKTKTTIVSVQAALQISAVPWVKVPRSREEQSQKVKSVNSISMWLGSGFVLSLKFFPSNFPLSFLYLLINVGEHWPPYIMAWV